MDSRLDYVEPSKYFWFVTGDCAKSLEELANKIKILDKDSFSFHVNNEKDDFASWIKEVIKDDLLAKRLEKRPRKDKYARIVEQRVKILKEGEALPSLNQHLESITKLRIQKTLKEIKEKLAHHSDLLDKYEHVRNEYRRLNKSSKQQIYPEILEVFKKMQEIWNRINY